MRASFDLAKPCPAPRTAAALSAVAFNLSVSPSLDGIMTHAITIADRSLKLFVVSQQKSEFGVEWMRFEADAAVPDLVRRVPHVAFEVTDLSSELAGREILIPPNSPSDGVRVAFIVENGAPIELLEFTDPKHPARLPNQMQE